MPVGFVGLGLMGQPMAANLRKAGVDLIVCNRSPGPRQALRALGARDAETPAELFAACETVILMLADDAATDWALGRGGEDFGSRVNGRLVINMGTHAPSYSERLDTDIRAAGGTFVEAPVSGSRLPAEAGQLIAMLAGTANAVARARPIIAPMCREMITVGAPPSAMSMKMAVNLYLIATVAALAEAASLADAAGLDLGLFRRILDGGPLRSDVSEVKLAKMVVRDFAPQASIRDVVKNCLLVARTAAETGTHAPLLGESLRLFDAVLGRGDGELDMAAVISAFGRSERVAPDPALGLQLKDDKHVADNHPGA
jgi:3-hydroxyisobutyrate dehydrogenase